MCFDFSLQLFSETFVILRKNKRVIIINLQRPSCKVPVIPVRFKPNLHFPDRLSKNTQTSSFTKIRQIGDKLFHADGRTDRHGEADGMCVCVCVYIYIYIYIYIYWKQTVSWGRTDRQAWRSLWYIYIYIHIYIYETNCFIRTDRQTDRHGEAYGMYVCMYVYKPKSIFL